VTNQPTPNDIEVTSDSITLSFGDMEPVVIPRTSLRTRLQLIDWVYFLTDWPGMNRSRLRSFIAAIFAHHGWASPESKGYTLANAAMPDPTGKLQLQTAAGI
jgi:hypothetical protein